VTAVQTDRAFAGAIPALYDRCLGPCLFAPYAAELAARLGGAASGTVLELAAGTGIVTRALLRALPAAVRIVATDLNRAMLDVAATRLSDGRVEWRQADALRLSFAAERFAAVVCGFGAMFFPDRIAGYREALRVLRPGGPLVFTVWDRIAENELADIVTDALAALFPADPPRFLVRTPHGYHDPRTIRRELREAGFAQVRIDALPRRSRAPSYRDPVIGLCQGTPLRGEIEARAPGRLDEVTEVAAAAVAARFGTGPIDAKMSALLVEARR